MPRDGAACVWLADMGIRRQVISEREGDVRGDRGGTVWREGGDFWIVWDGICDAICCMYGHACLRSEYTVCREVSWAEILVLRPRSRGTRAAFDAGIGCWGIKVRMLVMELFLIFHALFRALL